MDNYYKNYYDQVGEYVEEKVEREMIDAFAGNNPKLKSRLINDLAKMGSSWAIKEINNPPEAS